MDFSFDRDTVVVVLFELVSLVFDEVYTFLLLIMGREFAFSISFEARI